LLFVGQIFINEILPVASKHSVGFSRTCLAIGKDSKIGAGEYFFGEGLKMIEYLKLGFLLGDDLIEFALNVVDLVVVNFEGFVLK
jgi:hypothetical protein